jgi:glutathione peroxidase
VGRYTEGVRDNPKFKILVVERAEVFFCGLEMNMNIDKNWMLIRGAVALAIGMGVMTSGGWQAQPEKKDQPTEKPKEAQPAEKPAEPAKSTKPAAPAEPAKDQKPAAKAAENYVLGYKMKSLDGKDIDLSSFKGKVVLMVNVASNCGQTKQYADMQKLYEQKREKGFVILGFPANNFLGQEPGSDAEIAKFCKEKYSVTFPMFSKISVKGDDVHPLYKQLAAKAGGEPSWNFTKYLVDREGNVVQRFDPKTKPDDAGLVKKIDELLGAGEKPKNG